MDRARQRRLRPRRAVAASAAVALSITALALGSAGAAPPVASAASAAPAPQAPAPNAAPAPSPPGEAAVQPASAAPGNAGDPAPQALPEPEVPAGATPGALTGEATPSPLAAPATAAPSLPGTALVAGAPTSAMVEIHADRPGCWLELRPVLGADPWVRACAVPCGTEVSVDGKEARIAGPGLSPSNPFRIEAGGGVARLEVDTGSLRARRLGIASLAGGLPLALLGMAAFALGKVDDAPAASAAGIAAMAVGGAGVVVAFPLVRVGATRVKDVRGRRIAATNPPRGAR